MPVHKVFKASPASIMHTKEKEKYQSNILRKVLTASAVKHNATDLRRQNKINKRQKRDATPGRHVQQLTFYDFLYLTPLE